MGMRQPARLPLRPAYGLPGVAGATEHSGDDGTARGGAPSGALPLLILVILLGVAALWFVARPALENRPQPQRTCEVIVLKSGTTKCVHEPKRAPLTAHAKSTSPAKP